MVAALSGNEGAEILEFAISLPLLLVVAVGVFDFGSAFTVKQKVGNVALQGARFASNQPTNDLSLVGACGAPASICSVRDVVESNLVASRLNDCGLGTRERQRQRCSLLDIYRQCRVRGNADLENRARLRLHGDAAGAAVFRRITRLKRRG